MLKNGVDVSLLPLLSPWVLEFESLAVWHLVVVAAVVSVFVLYCLTEPLEVQLSVPGPRRYPWPVGYLWYPIRHWPPVADRDHTTCRAVRADVGRAR